MKTKYYKIKLNNNNNNINNNNAQESMRQNIKSLPQRETRKNVNFQWKQIQTNKQTNKQYEQQEITLNQC